MSEVLIFAGTLEGRTVAEMLNAYGVPAHVCVATSYGESLLPETGSLTVSHERLDAAQMEELMRTEHPRFVIDATHPYAAEVTKNIRTACEQVGMEYRRLLRSGYEVTDADVIYAESVPDAVEKLGQTTGNILATTGSKELAAYTKLENYRERVFARVLSLPGVVAACAELGFEGKHLICMQGPFSLELNVAMLKQYNCRYLVTKESGSTGGFMEKYEAARQAGARLVLIGRPVKEEGMTLRECQHFLREQFHLEPKQEITLVGIGMGTREGMTIEAQEACRRADLIIGAKRMTEQTASPGQPVFHAYKADEIAAYIREHPEFEKVVIVLSGDVGFYSGAKKLLEVLPGDVKILPGISSMISFLSKLKMPWEDTLPCSLHGRDVNLMSLVKANRKVFAIVGNADGIGGICRDLCTYGMEDVRVFVGERLSYPDEKITEGTAASLTELTTDPLSVVLLINEAAADHIVTHGIPDEAFLRGKAPMTKEEIREISVSKMRLSRHSIVYDVGAGTGSVSVEMALMADCGTVYAIEKKAEAAELLRRNREKFGVPHLHVIEGLAPEALKDLPVPTHAFIGGSSGNLKEIMELLLAKNPEIRVVINCITLETVAEVLDCLKTLPLTDVDVAQVSVAKSKQIGRYHMMMGQNPIYIISCEGLVPEEEGV